MEMHLKHRKKNRLTMNVNVDGGLPKTGQQFTYYPYDDGHYKMGYPLGGAQRFNDNGDGTVTDNATGLMWVSDPMVAGLGSPMYWYDAIDACENLNFAGHSDWRMPNINELLSIYDHSRYDPAWDTNYFAYPPDPWSIFWSSTICAPWTDGAWAVDTYDSYKSPWGIPWDMWYVRPVRGGQS